MRWYLMALLCGCDGTAVLPPPPPAPGLPTVQTSQVEALRRDGWVISGGARDAYTATDDTGESRVGHATVHLAHPAEVGGYGTFMRVADAAPYRGKRVRMSAWVKTRGATERADFWGRVQAADSPGDGPGLGGRWTRLPAASDWQSTQIVFDVAAQAATLNYGVGVAGPGDLWVDAPSLEVVGADVPITPMPERQVADAKFEGEQTVGVTGVGAPDHALSQDGAAVKVSPTVADPKRFVHVLRVEKADAYVGKTIKITFEVKADGSVSGGCVAKALGASQWVYMGRTFGTAFQEQPAGATNGFVTCELSLTVAEGARWILYGHASRGSGNVWVKGGSIAVP